jgi:hypothetical protein
VTEPHRQVPTSSFVVQKEDIKSASCQRHLSYINLMSVVEFTNDIFCCVNHKIERRAAMASGLYSKTITIVIMTIISDDTILSVTYGRN